MPGLAETAISVAGKTLGGVASSLGFGKSSGKGAKDQPANESDVPVSASDYPAKVDEAADGEDAAAVTAETDGETVDGEDAAAVTAETDGETVDGKDAAAVALAGDGATSDGEEGPAGYPIEPVEVASKVSLWDKMMKWMDTEEYQKKYGPGSGAKPQYANAEWVYKKIAELNVITVPREDNLAGADIESCELRVEGPVKAAKRNKAKLDANFQADKTLSLTAPSFDGCPAEIGAQLEPLVAAMGDGVGTIKAAFSKHKVDLSPSNEHSVFVELQGQAVAERNKAGDPVEYALTFEVKLDGKTEAVEKVKDALAKNPLTKELSGETGTAEKAAEKLFASFRPGVKAKSPLAKALFDGEKIPASAFK